MKVDGTYGLHECLYVTRFSFTGADPALHGMRACGASDG
jgi:hypothetical protein